MLANRPKGISINRNAINIQANQLGDIGAAGAGGGAGGGVVGVGPQKRTPSPPRLKSLSNPKQSSNDYQNNQNLLLDLEVLKPLQPSYPKQQTYSKQDQQIFSKQPELLELLKGQVAQQPKQPQSENDGVVVGPLLRSKQQQLEQLKPQPLPQQTLKEQQQLVSRIPRLRNESEEEIEDIDKSVSRDAIYLVCDVAKDIYQYMYDLEEEQSIKHDYLKDQKIMTPRVRQRLINWVIDIHSQLKLLQETLYMSIAVIDRYFDQVTVQQQSQVQLVAIGATLIASKYEEIYPADVGDLIFLTQNTYSRRDLMRIEIEILEKLNFNLGKPIPLAFLRRFSKAAHCDMKMHSIAKFLMEISLSEYECCHWKPSFLAASALFTTIHLMNRNENDNESNSTSSTTTYSTTISRTTSSLASRNSIAGFGLARRLPFSSSSSSLINQGRSHLSTITSGVSSSSAPTTIPDRWNKTLVHYTHYTRREMLEPAATLCKILKKVLKSPQSYFSVKKNLASLSKWPELKSGRVDELIRLGEQTKA